jgi:hypothetical protein
MSDDKKSKPTYQAPVVMPLGELAAAEGQTCQSGGTASSCRTGSRASNNCSNGTTAGNRCGMGTSPKCFLIVF